MTDSVLDILIYVFDRYMLEETPDVPERDDLARDLTLLGFGPASVERALDWLADLADARAPEAEAVEGAEAEPERRQGSPRPGGVRIYTDAETSRLSTECRGQIMALEQMGILSGAQREIVIDRMLALDGEELDAEQLRWVVLMVLSSQPGQEQAFARMENLMIGSFGLPPN